MAGEAEAFTCYLITNEVSGRQYVGITHSVAKRWRQHVAIAHTGGGGVLHQAIRKHGAEAFTVRVLSTHATWAEAQAAERAAILAHGSKRPRGYNMTDGGEGVRGMPVSDETREKLRAILAQPEVKSRMRAAKLGKKQSPEHAARWVAAAHTPEARAKAAASRRGRKREGEALERIREAARRPDRVAKCTAAMHSPEARAKAVAAIRAKAATPEYKARRSAASAGRTHSPETRARIAQAMREEWVRRRAARQATELAPPGGGDTRPE